METGRTILHYRLGAKIGVGGMGEVWQATDATLGREVAIKILPPGLGADPDRLARFEREAKVLASLNHPNIASIFGFHEDAGVRFLAMELVPGEDLAERLNRGRIPVEEAVEIAKQIAEALEAAHEQGIVHRDLKPANVRITPEGRVKVLDFGLAKAIDPAVAASGLHGEAGMSPTVTSLGTVAGVILGTAAYMSPEQARGKPADRRADIWAFGVILFEMLTGKRLFEGETISDTLAEVLKTKPDWSALPASTPAPLRRLIERCLERDPRLRLRDIGEARIALSGAMKDEPAAATPAPATKSAGARLPWILLGFAAIAVVVLAVKVMSPAATAPPRVRKFAFDAGLSLARETSRTFQISPDNTNNIYQSARGIELRELHETAPRLLVPTADLGASDTGATPFWSPDGLSIGYTAMGSLSRIAAAGGAPTTICKLPGTWNGGTWTAGDTIVFSTTRGPMYAVPARGGDPAVFIPLQGQEDLDFHHPNALPGSHGIIYPVHRAEGVDTIELFRDGKRSVVLRIESKTANVHDSPQIVNAPFYSPTGHILYQRDQDNVGLWAIPFSLESGKTTGEPFLVASKMGYPSAAADGTLVYAPQAGEDLGQLMLVGRDGKVERTLGGVLGGVDVGRFSADGRRLLYVASERQGRDVFVWDFAADKATRLTDTPGSEGEPTWIPGGGRVAFSAPSGTCRSVFALNADGTGTRELLADKAQEPTFTPDGREFVYTTACQDRRGLDRVVVGKPGATPLVDAPAGIDSPELSPDGRYLTYNSWVGGSPQRYVTRYPSMDGRWEVSGGQLRARWAADGQQIYFIAGTPPRMMSVPVQPDPVFSSGTPKELFPLEAIGADLGRVNFDVSPDGKHFALVRLSKESGGKSSIYVVENWIDEFKR